MAVPYGGRTEPGNVKAGDAACPIRFQCAGCGFYRATPSCLSASISTSTNYVLSWDTPDTGTVTDTREASSRPYAGVSRLAIRCRALKIKAAAASDLIDGCLPETGLTISLRPPDRHHKINPSNPPSAPGGQVPCCWDPGAGAGSTASGIPSEAGRRGG